jgi:hypothetical protein
VSGYNHEKSKTLKEIKKIVKTFDDYTNLNWHAIEDKISELNNADRKVSDHWLGICDHLLFKR